MREQERTHFTNVKRENFYTAKKTIQIDFYFQFRQNFNEKRKKHFPFKTLSFDLISHFRVTHARTPPQNERERHNNLKFNVFAKSKSKFFRKKEKFKTTFRNSFKIIEQNELEQEKCFGFYQKREPKFKASEEKGMREKESEKTTTFGKPFRTYKKRIKRKRERRKKGTLGSGI